MALGIDPENPEEFSSKSGSDPQTTKGEKVSVKRDGFSSEELRLLQKMPARVWGSLSVAFYKMLRADLVDANVGDRVTVEVRPHEENGVPEPLSVREAVRVGLEPYV